MINFERLPTEGLPFMWKKVKLEDEQLKMMFLAGFLMVQWARTSEGHRMFCSWSRGCDLNPSWVEIRVSNHLSWVETKTVQCEKNLLYFLELYQIALFPWFLLFFTYFSYCKTRERDKKVKLDHKSVDKKGKTQLALRKTGQVKEMNTVCLSLPSLQSRRALFWFLPFLYFFIWYHRTGDWKIPWRMSGWKDAVGISGSMSWVTWVIVNRVYFQQWEINRICNSVVCAVIHAFLLILLWCTTKNEMQH